MANTDFVPSKTTRTDVQIGLVVADQRTSDFQWVIYADAKTVFIRGETDTTTQIQIPRGVRKIVGHPLSRPARGRLSH